MPGGAEDVWGVKEKWISRHLSFVTLSARHDRLKLGCCEWQDLIRFKNSFEQNGVRDGKEGLARNLRDAIDGDDDGIRGESAAANPEFDAGSGSKLHAGETVTVAELVEGTTVAGRGRD
jgi:hypothetical protein